jgi:cytochrome P450
MTIREALRLYPPIWGAMRRAVKDDVIGGYHVPAGSGIVISAFVVHRSASVWEDPLRFVPERFLPERSEVRHRFAWFPFGAGPRQCIGIGLAMLELTLTLATLLQNFDFDLLPGSEVRPSPRIALQPDRAVKVRLKVRPGMG